MALPKNTINKIDRYINNGYNASNCLFETQNQFFATNGYSIILFAINGDDPLLLRDDFCGMEIRDGKDIKNSKVWEHTINPFWTDADYNYNSPVDISISDFERDTKLLKEEYGLKRDKLYLPYVSQNHDIGCLYHGMWLCPELMLDVGLIIANKKDTVELFIPHNKRNCAVIKNTNKYGTHLGFVCGTVKNFR